MRAFDKTVYSRKQHTWISCSLHPVSKKTFNITVNVLCTCVFYVYGLKMKLFAVLIINKSFLRNFGEVNSVAALF